MTERVFENLGFDTTTHKYKDAVDTLKTAGFTPEEISQLTNGKKKNGYFRFTLPNGNILGVEALTGNVENTNQLNHIHMVLDQKKLFDKQDELRNILEQKGLPADEAIRIADSLHYDSDYRLVASCYNNKITGRLLDYILDPNEKLPSSITTLIHIKNIFNAAFGEAKAHPENWKNNDLNYINSMDVTSISFYTPDEKKGVRVIGIVNFTYNNKELHCGFRFTGRYSTDSIDEDLTRCFLNGFNGKQILDNLPVNDLNLDTVKMEQIVERRVKHLRGALHEITVDDLKAIKNSDQNIYTMIYLLGGCQIKGKGKWVSSDTLTRLPGKHIVFQGIYKRVTYRFDMESGCVYTGKYDENHAIPFAEICFIKKLVRTWKAMTDTNADSTDSHYSYQMYFGGKDKEEYKGRIVATDETGNVINQTVVGYTLRKPEKEKNNETDN